MDFKQKFEEQIRLLHGDELAWKLIGILMQDSRVYTLSFDLKILSGIFEILCEPMIQNIASKHKMKCEKAKQNQYPEFTLFLESEPDRKIAIDIKSTYRQYNKNGELKPFGFTLGSYRSYLRDPEGRRGILYPYEEYAKHWIIGFLYTRNLDNKITEIRQVIESSQLIPPFTDIEYFIQEKYRIAGRTLALT